MTGLDRCQMLQSRGRWWRLSVALGLVPILIGTAGVASAENVLTLDDAFRLSLRNHEQFRISMESLRRVRLLEKKAWALLLPTLRVQGEFTIFDRGIDIDIPGGRIVLQGKNAFSGLGSFSMSLFDARSIPGLRQTKIQGKAAAESTAFTKADLLFEVARAYFTVLAAQRLVEINEHTVKVNEEHVRDAVAQLRAGQLIKLAVTRARIEVVRAKRELTKAENALRAGQIALEFLTGRKGPFSLRRPPPPTVPDLAPGDLVARAWRSRRDLLAATHEIDAAKKGMDMAWGAFVPRLGVVASSRATQNTGFQGRILSSQTLFTLEWTIFDGGTRYAELKEKHSLLREAILKKSLLSRTIGRDVKQALLDLKTAEAALFASRKELELAKENHAMVTARFRAGLATTIEAVDAATQLSTAEASVLREELNRDTIRITLLRAIGADPILSLTGGSSGREVKGQGLGGGG